MFLLLKLIFVAFSKLVIFNSPWLFIELLISEDTSNILLLHSLFYHSNIWNLYRVCCPFLSLLMVPCFLCVFFYFDHEPIFSGTLSKGIL